MHTRQGSRGSGGFSASTSSASRVPDPLVDAVVLVDRHGVVLQCSAAAADLVGQEVEALVGAQAVEVLPFRLPTGRSWWEEALPLALDAVEEPRVPLTDVTIEVGNEPVRRFELKGRRVADERGGLLCVVLTLHPVRSRALQDAAADLLSVVSHEVRSPLTAVKGYALLLQRRWADLTDERKLEMLRTIEEQADRATKLLGELLEVGRLEAGRVILRPERLDLPAFVAQVLRRVAGQDGQNVAAQLDPQVSTILADPDRLEQVLVNLLENALRYGGGHVTLKVELAVDQGVECVRVVVGDDGGAIAADSLERLFEKFYRAPDERREGTGLGLYIVKGLVEAHGGQVSAESDPQHGTRFSVLLPQT